MQATLNIQDSIWQQALKLSGMCNENELILLALTEFIQNHNPDYIRETELALIASCNDLKQGNYSKNDIDAHVNEIFNQ